MEHLQHWQSPHKLFVTLPTHTPTLPPTLAPYRTIKYSSMAPHHHPVALMLVTMLYTVPVVHAGHCYRRSGETACIVPPSGGQGACAWCNGACQMAYDSCEKAIEVTGTPYVASHSGTTCTFWVRSAALERFLAPAHSTTCSVRRGRRGSNSGACCDCSVPPIFAPGGREREDKKGNTTEN